MYCCTTATQVVRPDLIAACSSSIVASSTRNGVSGPGAITSSGSRADCRVENDLAERLVGFDETMGRGRLAQRKDAVDQHLERAGAGELERALQVFASIGAQSADDAQPLLVETPHVERDEPAAVRADGHEPTSRRQAVVRTRPQRGIADVLEDHVDASALGDPHDLSLEILLAIVHPEYGSKRHGDLDPPVRPGGGDRA